MTNRKDSTMLGAFKYTINISFNADYVLSAFGNSTFILKSMAN